MLAILLTLALATFIGAKECPNIRSCSTESLKDADSCCSPSPAGLFVFRQRFEPDVGGEMGSWGIDGLEVLQSAYPSSLVEPSS